jgi:hypothetical protein
MSKKHLWLAIMIVMFVFPLSVESQSSSRVTPGISQTVVTIQRHPRSNESRKEMEIYIDGHLYQTTGRKPRAIGIENGGMVSVPVNNGVHTIYVKVGKYQSDSINFTANGETIPFVASVEGGVRGLIQDTVDLNTNEVQSIRTRVVLSRSIIEDDTGTMVNRSVQDSY